MPDGSTRGLSAHNDSAGGHDNAGGAGRICAADRQWGSFNHVTDPHFATFSSSLYTTFGTINLLFYDTVHFLNTGVCYIILGGLV